MYNEAMIQAAIWIKNFIYGLKVVDFIQRPIKILYDNSTVMFFLKIIRMIAEESILT